MNAKQLVYVGIIIGIIYLLYQCYVTNIESFVNSFNKKKKTEHVIPDPYIQPLDLVSFNNVTEITNSDALDIIVFNKLKNRRNLVYSSLGLRYALLLMFLGSSQNSQDMKMYNKIFGKNDVLSLAYHRDLKKYMSQSGNGMTIRFMMGVWYDNQALQLNPYYQKQISCISGCHYPIQKTDYEDMVSILTDGYINTFEYESLDETLLIISAMYFEFKIKTDPKKSYIDRFVSWDGHESEVKYMNNIDHYLYVMDTTAQALLINYNTPFSLLIVLPKNGEEPEPMTNNDITKTISMMRKTKIDLYLPRIEYDNVHQLINPVTDIGFSYVAKSGYNRAIIGRNPTVQIVQKTKVSIVEDSQYTSLVNIDTDASLPKTFRADHSFLYYIIHMPTKKCIISGIFNSL